MCVCVVSNFECDPFSSDTNVGRRSKKQRQSKRQASFFVLLSVVVSTSEVRSIRVAVSVRLLIRKPRDYTHLIENNDGKTSEK